MEFPKFVNKLPSFEDTESYNFLIDFIKMFRPVFFICCAFVGFSLDLASAMTAEQKAQIHEHFETIGKMCFKDNPVTAEDIVNLRAKQMPTGANSSCFIACVMRYIGVMDNEGLVQKETALELAKSVFNDAEELKIIEDYLHSCSHVNSEAVSDGTKGCDRAMIAYKCMTENASQFGFDI